MIDPNIINAVSQTVSQGAQQVGNFFMQELSKPHNKAHLAKAASEVISSFWKK